MSIIEFKDVYIDNTATVAGPYEAKGPMEIYFDKKYNDLRIGMQSFEKAEMKMMDDVIKIIFKKTQYNIESIGCTFSGDLINQNIITNYTLRGYNVPVSGLYSACSTSCLSIIIGSIYTAYTKKPSLCLISSHNATSERQFRNPNEYGGAKLETSTKTATGAGALILTSDKRKIRVKRALIGRIIDVGLNRPDDMGRAMAPAACESILEFLRETNTTPKDYDYILTGDLSKYGSDIVLKMLEEEYGYVENYNDCGMMLYDPTLKVYCGGSGCACLPLVTYGYIYSKLKEGKLNRVLLCATGALMNTTMTLQHETIPAICHVVLLESVK